VVPEDFGIHRVLGVASAAVAAAAREVAFHQGAYLVVGHHKVYFVAAKEGLAASESTAAAAAAAAVVVAGTFDVAGGGLQAVDSAAGAARYVSPAAEPQDMQLVVVLERQGAQERSSLQTP